MRLIILSIFLATASIAQQKDYLQYHSYINKAEDNLVIDRADSVFYYYDKAFAEFNFIFAKDALVASQFAWKHHALDRTISYLIKGSYSGLRSAHLDDVTILRDFVNSRIYDRVYDSMKIGNFEFSKSISQDLRAEWIEKYGELGIAKDEADFIDVVRSNVERVRQLMVQHKYPGGAVIGLSDYLYEMENYTAYTSLTKYDCVVAELHDGLWEAVKMGQLHPRDFAALWEKEQIWLKAEAHANIKGGSNRITNRKCPGMKTTERHFKIIPTTWKFSNEEIDKDRTLYKICSIETDRKKKELETIQGYILFFGPREDNGMVEFH